MQGNPPDWEHYSLPDAAGHFGPYGGVFVAETLRQALDELTLAYSQCREDPAKIVQFIRSVRLEDAGQPT